MENMHRIILLFISVEFIVINAAPAKRNVLLIVGGYFRSNCFISLMLQICLFPIFERVTGGGGGAITPPSRGRGRKHPSKHLAEI